MTRFVPLLCFLILLAVLAMGLLNQPRHHVIELSGSMMEKKLSAFALHDRSGKRVQLDAASLSGKVTLISFFASWCTSCAEEHPILLELSHTHKVALLGIAWNDSVWNIEDWLTQHRNPYDSVMFDREGRGAIALGVRGLPESFIVDKHGMLRYHLPGPMTPELYEQVISPLLTQLESEPS